MKIIEITGHQGDTQWARIDAIPTSAKLIDKSFIAKSERTGSVHALSGNYKMYEYEESFAIECLEDCVLNHTYEKFVKAEMNSAKILPPKDHRHSIIKKGLYLVGIQNRFDPLEATKKKVVD